MSWYFFSTGHKLSFPGHFLNIKRKLYCLRHLLWRDRHCWRRPLSIPCHQDDGCRPFLLGKSPETQPVVVSSGRLIPLWQVNICHFVFWASPVVFNCLVWVWVFLCMNLASVSTGLIFVQLSDSWHWPMLEKFIYTIFMFPKTRWLIFILCIVILLSDNSISDGLQKWCGLLKMKLLAVVKCNLHTSIIWVLALVKMASFLVVVHLMGLLTGL